jgi:hypothetical protein
MTTQRAENISELSLLTDPSVPTWSSGTPDDGVDARLELAVLGSGMQMAVREARNPGGPTLLFSLADWQTLIGTQPDLVDLR